MATKANWRWVYRPARGNGDHALDLKTPAGDAVAASVYLYRNEGGHCWHVWREDGVGGENGVEPTVVKAMHEAWEALRRCAWHGSRRARSEPK